MTTTDLQPYEFDPYYGRYIDKLSRLLELRKSFIEGKSNVVRFFETIPTEKLEYQYEPGKWNCKQILQHLIDTERVFQYRCFRIARNDKTELAGFDQTIYIDPSNATQKPLDELIREFEIVREGSISLLNSLSDEDLMNIGTANNGDMSARAAAFTITGHEIWHMEIISKKYL